ncbi:unnamed protein product, partial [marine sediment metagenome]
FLETILTVLLELVTNRRPQYETENKQEVIYYGKP